MRNVAAAVLAVPVLAVIYLPVLARRSIAIRIGLVLGIGLIVLIGAFGLARPAPITATTPSAPITALADAAFRSIGAATDLRAPVRITFSEPMDPTSIAATLTVSPATLVNLGWDAAATTLTITPRDHWRAGTYHTISLDPGALAASGRPMSSSVRAAFVTRPATSGRIVAGQVVGETAALGSTFEITFDRPVETSRLTAALRIAPALDGVLEAVGGSADGSTPGSIAEATTFVFRPAVALTAGATYRFSTDGLVDADGAALVTAPSLTIATTAAAQVVRFRPADGTQKVDRAAILSIRFAAAMKHATTRAAVVVTADGKPVAGTVTFVEAGKVLVFKPTAPLPYGALVVLRVGATATTVSGTPLAGASQVSFRVIAKPAPTPKAPAPAPKPTPKPITSGGGAVGGGSWGAVETYYLKLMNCTRTGGWVTSTGACSSPGGRNVAALKLDAGISTKVSRPYAKKLTLSGVCSHFSGGTPGDRLRAAGYYSYKWAENLGCQGGNPYAAVLATHIYFQSEKSYGGGHYVNMMNALYDRVGIGVWVSSGRLRLVIDFYHP
ncbi:MAG TPA: Ig-like domain-containing protein [Candidatus Bathyarchaeia archaeon]|nr:Ig-like domain-containing protein [Candidatus Bathyarchaeia archaeon]